ncbi:hypothetical protein KY314_00610 [Candidatus Woesearchaeota archaeon]|nr:hypothetical protein [Candidatus Woesearchaeota archaeon]
MTTKIQKQIEVSQHNKLSVATQMDEPGFLSIEILAKDPEKTKEKIDLVHQTVSKMIDTTRKQKKIIVHHKLAELNKALSNEISVCQDILKITEIHELIEKIDELKQKIQVSLDEMQNTKKK